MPDNLEIERRFMVDGSQKKPWRQCESQTHIVQYYLNAPDLSLTEHALSYNGIQLVVLDDNQYNQFVSDSEWTVRIRFSDELTYLTIKGRRTMATAVEFEWSLERATAEHLLTLADFPAIEKTRFNWRGVDGLLWEVDEFIGRFDGLIVAEIELLNEEQSVILPLWLGRELTGKHAWSNARLAARGDWQSITD